jgi:hypothetical protein
MAAYLGVRACVLIAGAWRFAGFRRVHIVGRTVIVSLSLGRVEVRNSDEADGAPGGVHVLPHAFIVEWLLDWDRGLILSLRMAFVPAALTTASLIVAGRLRRRHTFG